MPSLIDRYHSVWRALVDPSSLIPLALAVLFYISFLVTPGKLVGGVLALISAIFGGLFGGSFMRYFQEAEQKGPLLSKGKSAVRSLTALGDTVSEAEENAKHYMERVRQGEPAARVVELYFQNILTGCAAISRLVGNAVEEWIDVIPEAAKIGEVRNLKLQLSAREQEIEELEASFSASQQEKVNLKKGHNREIQQLKDEISKLQSDLHGSRLIPLPASSALPIGGWSSASLKNGLSSGTLAGSSLLPVGAHPTPFAPGVITSAAICATCGKTFLRNPLSSVSSGSQPDVCPTCW